MPRFLALTSRGLMDVLHDELNTLGFTSLQKTPGGVYFDANWAGCYRANLCLRTASRVAVTILDFPAYNPDDLYNNIRKHDFTKYISVNGTVAVDAHTDSDIFRDQRFVALKVKDAVVDQFTEKFGSRPNVDSKDPDLRILIRVQGNFVNVAIDTTGDPLFKRGYRVKSVEAPMKENLAAALVKMSEWDGKTPLVDPMCGSGTILLEAALIGMKISPGTLRRGFAFQKWSTLQKDVLKAEAEFATSQETDMPKDLLYGYDIDRKAIIAAQQNAQEAGLDEYIKFRRSPIELIEPPPDMKGIIICNPPYGARLGEIDELKDVYRNMGFIFKSKFKGWVAWVLCGEAELAPLIGMKASRRIPIMNGPIECRFLRYEIR